MGSKLDTGFFCTTIGLLSLSPDQTTLDPKTETLPQGYIESQVDADRTFQQLLGKDPSERYRVIMEESALVDDLDV